jgi:hypothetical protein
MRYAVLVLLLVIAGPLSAAVDDTRFFKLEQDVRRLEQTVRDLSRQLDELKEQLARGGAAAFGGAKSAGGTGASTAWIDAASWRRVQQGMSELDVIDILGLPTSMRPSEGGRVLLYATEIGSSGFLSGSVTLRDGRVTEVAPPVLK